MAYQTNLAIRKAAFVSRCQWVWPIGAMSIALFLLPTPTSGASDCSLDKHQHVFSLVPKRFVMKQRMEDWGHVLSFGWYQSPVKKALATIISGLAQEEASDVALPNYTQWTLSKAVETAQKTAQRIEIESLLLKRDRLVFLLNNRSSESPSSDPSIRHHVHVLENHIKQLLGFVPEYIYIIIVKIKT